MAETTSMESENPVKILTNYVALSVIADDRWPDESDPFGVTVFGFLLYGFAYKTCEELELPLSQAVEVVTDILSQHADCSENWATWFSHEAEMSIRDKEHHPGHYSLILIGKEYEAGDDMSQVVDNVYANIQAHRMSAEALGPTGNEWDCNDFQSENSLVLQGAPEFIQYCVSRGNCEFDQELIAKFQEIVAKYPFVESDEDEIDPPEQFAVVVRDGLIKAGLIPPDDPHRYQYKLSMAFIHFTQ